MKRTITILIISALLAPAGFAQDENNHRAISDFFEQKEKAQSTQELADDVKKQLLQLPLDNACRCIDSIETTNRLPEEINREIAKCIGKQIIAYQIGMNLFYPDPSKSDSTKDVNISIATSENSPQYKKYYSEIEGYLRENCTSLRLKIASRDMINKHSISENPEAMKFYSAGQKELTNDNYREAAACFEKAVEIDSLFAFAWDNLGLIYRKLNELDKAIACYQQSLRVDPYGLVPLQNIAVAYQYKGDFEKAIAAYEKLAEIDTNNAETFYGLALTYLGMKDFEKGLENACKSLIIYISQKSPYRSDAERLMSAIYQEMKKEGKLARFDEILKNNGISQGE
ncbi:MAG: tetratricopeptide repeat protein [Dysgonamonadaceae bacterium]|jgi:tetratricopeptide (TPR) repeat protein|nr:tetratricopeptide repeat protein [Dysgonamonadaceae bacterium]